MRAAERLYQGATQPVVIATGEKYPSEKGWQHSGLSWDDVSALKRVGGMPQPGHVLVDIDLKGERADLPAAERLRILRFLRDIADLPGGRLLTHTRTPSSADPLHGHWLYRYPLPQPGLRHAWGEYRRAGKEQGVCRGEGYRLVLPWGDIARALGAILAESAAGAHGGCNVLANEYAWWLGRQGARAEVVEHIWQPCRETWTDGVGALRNTVRRAHAKGSAGSAAVPAVTDRFKLYDDWATADPAPPDLLGLVSSRQRAVLAGDDGSGKTTLCASLAVAHCAAGGVVLWINAELGEAQLGNTLKRVGARKGLRVLHAPGEAWTAGDAAELLAEARGLLGDGPLLTIIDSGLALDSGIDADAWTSFLEAVGWDVLKEAGGVILIEHVGSGDRTRPRGDKGKTTEPDTVLVVTKGLEADFTTKRFTARMGLKVRKDREGMHAGRKLIDVAWADGGVVTEYVADADPAAGAAVKDDKVAREAAEKAQLREDVLEMRAANPQMSVQKIADRLGVGRQKVRTILGPKDRVGGGK